MKIASVLRLLSVTFLTLAVALVAYGLFGLSHFARYTGEYSDERLVLFDNGVYPFMWGVMLLIIGQLACLRHRRPAMLLAAGTAFALFVWMHVSVPLPLAGQAFFPDVGLLDSLIAICVVVLCLALADRPIQSLLGLVFRRSSPRHPR
ncbi:MULTISPECIES: hypothetical protein [unclassified Caballeronia]|uniref:hypothetical protein n=1 Tax=unclassified Caballeronia TaxID=2646786 RepID=UPI00286285A3|nr:MULTISPECIES: hypothetical protein [unclassified Caballeronia]MDR5753698.1 hypothetical protein [Caballeronia sp. LZ024]MDR5840077.1 hypothetical protein [Caballeronia sp. LZ031]